THSSDNSSISGRGFMRPCQQCNAGLMNAEKICPACGAEQQPTVGFLKSTGFPSAPHPETESSRRFFEELEDVDVDPILAGGACGVGLAGLAGMSWFATPAAASVSFLGAGLLAAFVSVSLFGGS